MEHKKSWHENSIASLITAPLTAVSKANMSMLAGQTRFILNNCFKKDEQDVYQPLMVSMTISRQHSTNAPKSTLVFQVPLLSLLPLNSLAVEKVKLDFSLDITTVTSYNSSSDRTDLLKRKTVLNGRLVKNEKGESNQSAHLKVNINASSIPLPDGMKTLIELYSKAILPSEEPSTESQQP